MITAIVIMLVIGVLATVMVANVVSENNGLRRQRNVTTARAAADAGVDRMVFVLAQSTGGVSNWDSFVTNYNSSQPWFGDSGGWSVAGKGRYRVHVDSGSDATIRVVTVQGEYPTGSGQTRTVRAELRRQAPAALDFAVFADKGFDLHHHGSSWISPVMVTPKIHSNGYIKLDYSSQFTVDVLEAATDITLGAGGGSTPAGSIPAGGYSWPYWISGADASNPPRCYPSLKFPPQDFVTTGPNRTWNAPDASNNCPAGQPKYSPNTQVLGNLAANTVTVTVNGDTTSTPPGAGACSGTTDPITGVCIPARPGDIDAGSVTLNKISKTWTGPATGNAITVHGKNAASGVVADCSVCEQGTADAGGSVGGKVNIHNSAWTPGTVPFPSLDYRTFVLPQAQIDQGTPGSSTCPPGSKVCHVFADGTALFNYISTSTNITNGSNGVDYASLPNPTGCANACVSWLDSAKRYTTTKANVAYVVMRGTYYLLPNGDLNLDAGIIAGKFGTTRAPELMVSGAVVLEQGDVTVKSSFTVVGPAMSPFDATKPNCTATIVTGCLPANTVPGLLAAGGTIKASDYDSDSNWTSTGQYEATKRNASIIRGLVYTGIWNAATKTSTPADQHWHNYDAKNSSTIIGAQVGGKLHDCNNFQFSYDPLIRNLSGFTGGGGSIYVVSWREIGP